ncbi:alpha/beta hydrolase family protein [Cellulomonas hominis]
MRYRTAASSLVGVIALAVTGALTGPQWDPLPLSDPLAMQSTSTAIGDVAPHPTYEVRTQIVTVQLEGATVQAQITVPIGVTGDVPGVVFVHGAGTGSYQEAFNEQALALATSGVVTMVPDKRLDTYSLRHRDYEEMATDYAASVALLRTYPGVDPDDVGVYAESEGAWIAPVMAARDPSIAFLAMVSAPVVPPREQAAYATGQYLRNTGVPDEVFRAIPRAVGMSLPGGGFEYADFDVSPYLRQVTVPVLMVYGTGDASTPMVQGAEQVIRDLAIAGNASYTLRYYAGASHGLRIDDQMSQAFLTDLTNWVVGLPATADAWPRIAGAAPTQEYWATPVPQPRWLGDGDAVVALVLGAVGAIVLLPLARSATRAALRGRGGGTVGQLAAGVAARVGWLSALSVGTVVALVWYLVAVARLALGYERNVWIVQGGWVVVRVLGIAAVVAGVTLVDRLRQVREGGDRFATGVLSRVVLWGPALASLVLLVVLAYWGVFQLGI